MHGKSWNLKNNGICVKVIYNHDWLSKYECHVARRQGKTLFRIFYKMRLFLFTTSYYRHICAFFNPYPEKSFCPKNVVCRAGKIHSSARHGKRLKIPCRMSISFDCLQCKFFNLPIHMVMKDK